MSWYTSVLVVESRKPQSFPSISMWWSWCTLVITLPLCEMSWPSDLSTSFLATFGLLISNELNAIKFQHTHSHRPGYWTSLLNWGISAIAVHFYRIRIFLFFWSCTLFPKLSLICNSQNFPKAKCILLTSSAGTQCWTFRPCRHAGDTFSPRFRPRPRRCLKCRSTSTWTWFLGLFFFIPCFLSIWISPQSPSERSGRWRSLRSARLDLCEFADVGCVSKGKIGEESERFVPMWFSGSVSPLALVVMLEE